MTLVRVAPPGKFSSPAFSPHLRFLPYPPCEPRSWRFHIILDFPRRVLRDVHSRSCEEYVISRNDLATRFLSLMAGLRIAL